MRLEYEGGTETLGRAESLHIACRYRRGEAESRRAGEASLVACYVPDLERDVVAPLREAGYSDEEIRGLGEVDV